MTSFLPDELKIKVKERLRDARFVAREMRPQPPRAGEAAPDGAGTPTPGVSELTRRISDFSETALQTLESVAISLLSSDPQAHFGEARAYPFERYGRTASGPGQAAFARDCYFAAKQILRGKGCANPRVSEELFATAFRFAADDWSLIAEDGADGAPLDAIARDAAIVTLAILRARPVQAPSYFEAEPEARPVATALYVASAIGLAMAVATYHRESLGDGDPIYPGVCAAVDARYAQLEKAIAGKAGPERLARVLADLIPHLP